MPTIKELEWELYRLNINNKENNNGFPISAIIKEKQSKKAIIKTANCKILSNFLYYLNRFGINLQICSNYEKGMLFRMYNKEEVGIKRTQIERNVLKEVIVRSEL